MAADKKGITVKVDADLHAEIREYLDTHQMTMAEFISLAVEDELHPKYQEKEENTMEKMRTLAFQVPEEFFQKLLVQFFLFFPFFLFLSQQPLLHLPQGLVGVVKKCHGSSSFVAVYFNGWKWESKEKTGGREA